MRIDLHVHSSVSDGTDTPTRLVHKAAEQGVDVIGLADHDTFDGLREARLAAAEVGTVTVMPGIEISCQRDDASVHLLGFGCDPNFEPLLDELTRVRVGRSGRIPGMLAKLAELSLPLSEEDLRGVGAGPSIGRPHVADAMVAKGYVRNRQEAFDRYLFDGGPAYTNRYSTDVRRAIELVRQARGVPVLAHPWGRGRESVLTPAVLTELALEYRLDGIEVDHPDHDARQRSELRHLAERLGLLTFGSSDHHGLGKVGHDLACNTTEPEVYDELVRRIRARGGEG